MIIIIKQRYESFLELREVKYLFIKPKINDFKNLLIFNNNLRLNHFIIYA